MSEEPVTADLPDSPFHTTGTDHVTVWESNAEDTVAFYRDLLGMPLVLRQPNLDDPSQTHLFFDTGDGRILTFFVGDRDSARGQRTRVGAVHHLCFSVDPERYEEVMAALDDDGRSYNVFDRGIFHSIYTKDNNGLVIELSADKYPIPDDRRGEVLADGTAPARGGRRRLRGGRAPRRGVGGTRAGRDAVRPARRRRRHGRRGLIRTVVVFYRRAPTPSGCSPVAVGSRR